MNCLYVCSGCSYVFKTQQTLLHHAASCPLVSRRSTDARNHRAAITLTKSGNMRPAVAAPSGIPSGASVLSSSAVCRLLGTGDSAPISGAAGALNITGSANSGESAQQYVYVCSMCRTMFYSVVLLKTHYENHWRGNVTDCLFCGWKGPDYHSFIEHIIHHHTERWRSEWTAPLGCSSTRLFTCRLCDGQFACPQLLRTHYSSHWQPVGLQSGRMLMCFCLRKLASYNRLLNHLCSHHTDAYELTEAGYQLVLSRPQELSASADFKQPTAKRPAAAIIETGRLLPPRRYECPTCLCNFPNVSGLVVHRKSTSCGRRVSSANITVGSSTVDSGSRPSDGAVSEPVQEQFVCVMCGEVFRFSSHLMRHKRERCMFRPNTGPEHAAARPTSESAEQVPVAGASRAAVGGAAEVSVGAVNQSVGVEQDAAAVATRTAGGRRRLGGTGEAVRAKNGKLLSRCGRCGLLFSCANAMKNHLDKNCIGEKMPTHVPPMHFECPSCQRKFDTDSMLKWHMVRECQLPSKFRCSVCLKYFMRGDHMRRHLRRVHKLQGEQLERAIAIGAASRSSAGSTASKDRRFRFKTAANTAASVACAHSDAGATCNVVDLTLDEEDAPSVAVAPPSPQNLLAAPVSAAVASLDSPILVMNAAIDRLNLTVRPLDAVVDSSVACPACQLMFLSPESLRSHMAATGCGRSTRPADDAAVGAESAYPSLGNSPSLEDALQNDPFRGIDPESRLPRGDMLTGSCRGDGVDSHASPMTARTGSVSVRRLCGGIVSIVKNGLAGSTRIPSPPSYEAAIKQIAASTGQRPRPLLAEPSASSGRESAPSLITTTSSPVLEAALVTGNDSAGPLRATVEPEADAAADSEDMAVTPSTPRLKVSRIASLRVFGRAADLSPALVIKEERLAFGEPLEEQSSFVGGEQVEEQLETTAPSDSAVTVKLESVTQPHTAGSLAVDSTERRSSVLESILTTDSSQPFHVELESMEAHAPQIKPEPTAQPYCDVFLPPPPRTPPLSLPPPRIPPLSLPPPRTPPLSLPPPHTPPLAQPPPNPRLAIPPPAEPLQPAAATPNSCLSAWFSCNMCRQAFTSPKNLADHVLHSHPDRVDQSPHMDATSRKKVSREMYRCRLCFKVLLFLSDFKRHCETHWRRAPYTCCICPAVMPDCGALSVHLITQHRDKVVRLNPDCVSSPDRLGSTVAWPSSGAALVGKPRSLFMRRCPICAHRFSNRNQLEKHCRGHWKEPPFYCDFCSKRFVSGNHLVKHVLSEHADGDSSSVGTAAVEPVVPSLPLKVPAPAAVQKSTSSASAVAKRVRMSRARCPHCNDPFREWRNVRRHVKNGSCRNMSLIGRPLPVGDAAHLSADLGAGGSPADNARADVGAYATSAGSGGQSALAGVKSGVWSDESTVKLIDGRVLPVIAEVQSDVSNIGTVESSVENALQDVEAVKSSVESAVADVYEEVPPFAEPSSAYIPPAATDSGLYCYMCGLHCRLRVELFDHLLVCSSRPPGHQLPYDCISCGVGLSSKHRLFDHALCGRCPAAASRRTALMQPRRDTRARCHNPPPNGQLRKRCPRCHALFFKRGHFAHVKHCRGTLSIRRKQHRLTEMSGCEVHADKGKSFRCRDCGRHFLSSNGRWRHRRGCCPMMVSSAAAYSGPVLPPVDTSSVLKPPVDASGVLKPPVDASGVLKPSRVHKKKRRTGTSVRRFLFRHVCALCGQKQENQLEMAHHLLLTHGYSGLASDLRASDRLLGSCPWCHQLRSLGTMERHCIRHWSDAPDGLVCRFCSQPQASAPQYFQHLTHRHFELFRAQPSELASQPAAEPLPTDFDLVPKFGCLCAVCGAKFQEQNELRAHLHLVHRFSGKHEPRSLIRMCPFCDLVRPIRYLKMHFADHWNAGHTRCMLCSRHSRSYLELFWHTYHCHFDAFRPVGAPSSSGQRCRPPVAVQAISSTATSTENAANVGASSNSKLTVVASAVTAADLPKPAIELSIGSSVNNTPARTGSIVNKCKPKSLVGAGNIAASIRVVKRTGKIACLWRCNVCNKRLDSRRRMEMHTCHRNRLFEFICRCCGVQPGGRTALIEHISAQHPGISKDEYSGGVKHTCNLSYRCPLCKDIVQLKSIKEHIFRAHWKHEPTVCAFCPRKLNNFISFFVHVSSTHFDRFVFAPKGLIPCSPATVRPSSASIAAQLPSAEPPAVVNYDREPAAGAADPAPEDEGFEEDCSSRWTPESYGSSPVESVAGTAAAGSTRCHHCSLVFPSTELLGLHSCRKLRGSFNNICVTCGTGCGTAEALVQHMQRVHQVSVAPSGGPSSRCLWYRCPFCTCVKRLSDMKSHWRSHWLHAPFSCKLCPRSLSLRAELFNHIAEQHFDALEYQPAGVGTAGAAAGDVLDARSPVSSDVEHRGDVDAPSTSKRTEPVEPLPPPLPRRSSATGDLRAMSAIALALLSPVVRLTRLERLTEWGSPNPGGDADTRDRYPCRKCDRMFGSYSGRNKHEKLRCPPRAGQPSRAARQLDELTAPRCADCGCVFRLRVALLQHRNRGCRLYCGSCGERFSDQLAKQEHSCSVPAGHQLESASPGQLERKLKPAGPQQEVSLPLAAIRTSPDPWQEERCGQLKKACFSGSGPDRSHSVVEVQDSIGHRTINSTPVLASRNVTKSHQSSSSTASVLREVSGSAVVQREEDSVMVERDSSVLQDDLFMIVDDADGSAVVDNGSVVVGDGSVVVEDDPVVVEDDPVMVEDDSVVVEHGSVVVEDDPVVVEDDSAVLDERSGSISAVGTGCVSARRRGELTRCEVCDKSMRRSSIGRHRQRMHGVGGAPRYSCPVCPWRGFDRSRAVCHVQRHVLSAEQLRRPDGSQLVPLITPISLQILHAQARVFSGDVVQERTASCGRIFGREDEGDDDDGHTDGGEGKHGYSDSVEETRGHTHSIEDAHVHADSVEDAHGHTDIADDAHGHTDSVKNSDVYTDNVEDALRYLDRNDLVD